MDGGAVVVAVGETDAAVARAVGEGAAVMITVRVGSGPPHPKASAISDKTALAVGKDRLAFNNLLP